ncbi:MAG: hypothetical protein LAO77_10210 [Acidobacteriia bacterium]|nr:hypothetical protein [Terriglobia bacterium]
MITAKDALAADLAKLTPASLKTAPLAELTAIAQKIRQLLIGTRPQADRALAANLSNVELTLALHRAFDWPDDRIVWDGGHQMDTHRIVTGRVDRFATPAFEASGRAVMKTEGGPEVIEAARGGTSISIALGIALGRALKGDTRPVVCVIGDGALAQGVALEALNHAASVPHVNLIVVLNDNSDSTGGGALHAYLRSLAVGRRDPEALFTSLGFDYIGPVDGHSVEALSQALDRARVSTQIPIVHVKTQRGYGSKPQPVRRDTNRFADAAAAIVADEMARDERLVVVVPAPAEELGFAALLAKLPDRVFAPRLDEPHSFAATVGLVSERYKPVVVADSAFLERAFDHVARDLCAGNVPVVVLAIGRLTEPKAWQGLPHVRVLMPATKAELDKTLREALREVPGPTLFVLSAGPAA